MKRYVSHKEVDAAKIISVGSFNGVDMTRILTLYVGEGEQPIPHKVSDVWYEKNSDGGTKELVGGYFVRYADGYESWSPAEAFEAGYTEIKSEQGAEDLKVDQVGKSFDVALKALKAGFRATRTGWNGADMHIELQTPTESSKMTLAYLFMKTAQGDLVPWLASQTDLLAEDWVITK